ncbi:MAG: hypothetical protein ACI4KF_10060 [Huintestinicola sp.]
MNDMSSVYNEKKVAAYEGLFREKPLEKPKEVYLTLTVAHLFGHAYVMEQHGTQEGDPVYQRFVCPLEEITKVYINDNVKASPLYIQCDSQVKGVLNRKRIIVPCLEDVSSIVNKIEEVRSSFMEKYEAGQEKIKAKKREELEAKRAKEQAELNAKKTEKLMNDHLEKLPTADEINVEAKPEPVKEAAAPKLSGSDAVKKLSSDIDDALKAFDAPVKPKKPALDLDKIPDAVQEAPKAEAPAAKEKSVPVVEVKPVVVEAVPVSRAIENVETTIPEIASIDEVLDAVPEPVPAPAPADIESIESIPGIDSIETADIHEAPIVEKSVKNTPAPAQVPVIDSVETAAAPVKDIPPVKPVAAAITPASEKMSLADFELAVKKLKAMSDNGVLSPEEFAAEKKKLIANLY